jgi:CRP-like cAMP-binding protein
MAPSPNVEAAALWLSRLDAAHNFSAAEREMVLGLFSTIESFPPRAWLRKEGEPGVDPFLLIEGLASCVRQTPSGRRQIVAVLTPGDLCDGEESISPLASQSVQALSGCRLAPIPSQAMADLLCLSPRVTLALRKLQLEQRRIQGEWLVNLGSRSTAGRLANFFCEMYERLKRVGLVRASVYNLPLTQQDLAEITGVSVIHVNRVLQQFRRTNLIRFSEGVLEILDLRKLQAIGEFDPEVLHLEEIRSFAQK